MSIIEGADRSEELVNACDSVLEYAKLYKQLIKDFKPLVDRLKGNIYDPFTTYEMLKFFTEFQTIEEFPTTRRTFILKSSMMNGIVYQLSSSLMVNWTVEDMINAVLSMRLKELFEYEDEDEFWELKDAMKFFSDGLLDELFDVDECLHGRIVHLQYIFREYKKALKLVGTDTCRCEDYMYYCRHHCADGLTSIEFEQKMLDGYRKDADTAFGELRLEIEKFNITDFQILLNLESCELYQFATLAFNINHAMFHYNSSILKLYKLHAVDCVDCSDSIVCLKKQTITNFIRKLRFDK